MKNFLVVAAVAMIALPLAARADGNDPTTLPSSTPVYVVASQASTTCVNALAAAAAQATVTIPACPAQQFFYLTMLKIQYGAIAAPAATLLATTTTNIPGNPTFNDAAPAATFHHDLVIPFPIPQKTTTAATATTIVGNAGVTSISQNFTACGFCAK